MAFQDQHAKLSQDGCQGCSWAPGGRPQRRMSARRWASRRPSTCGPKLRAKVQCQTICNVRPRRVEDWSAPPYRASYALGQQVPFVTPSAGRSPSDTQHAVRTVDWLRPRLYARPVHTKTPPRRSRQRKPVPGRPSRRGLGGLGGLRSSREASGAIHRMRGKGNA